MKKKLLRVRLATPFRRSMERFHIPPGMLQEVKQYVWMYQDLGATIADGDGQTMKSIRWENGLRIRYVIKRASMTVELVEIEKDNNPPPNGSKTLLIRQFVRNLGLKSLAHVIVKLLTRWFDLFERRGSKTFSCTDLNVPFVRKLATQVGVDYAALAAAPFEASNVEGEQRKFKYFFSPLTTTPKRDEKNVFLGTRHVQTLSVNTFQCFVRDKIELQRGIGAYEGILSLRRAVSSLWKNNGVSSVYYTIRGNAQSYNISGFPEHVKQHTSVNTHKMLVLTKGYRPGPWGLIGYRENSPILNSQVSCIRPIAKSVALWVWVSSLSTLINKSLANYEGQLCTKAYIKAGA